MAADRTGEDFEMNLYRLSKRGPDYATKAWAMGLLRDYWRRHPFRLLALGGR